MDIWQLDKLILFIAFVIPGFISIKVYTLFYPSEIKEASAVIIEAIVYSCINYSFFLPLIIILENNNGFKASLLLRYLFYLLVLFFVPVVWVYIWKNKRIRKIPKLMPHPTLKPWDFVFLSRNHIGLLSL